MPRTIRMPNDPMKGRINTRDTYIWDSPKARYIWIYTDEGALTIDTQYVNAQGVARLAGVSRATAYRIMRKLPRWWVSDVRDPDAPKCCSMVRRADLGQVRIYPRGNPNFASGIYQHDLARRPRGKRR